MRFFLGVFFFAFTGVQAFACPILSGQYLCGSGDNAEVLVISEAPGDRGLNLVVNDSKLIADNQIYSLDGDPTFRATVRTWCDDSGIKSRVNGEYYDNDIKIGSTELLTEYLLVDGVLFEVSTGNMTNQTDTFKVESKVPCTKQIAQAQN